jgi:hypothetical protein
MRKRIIERMRREPENQFRRSQHDGRDKDRNERC